MQSYFDFHFHPVFKAFIQKYEASYPSERNLDDLFETFDLTNPITDVLDNAFLHILELSLIHI